MSLERVIAERQAIKRERPLHNIMHIRKRRMTA